MPEATSTADSTNDRSARAASRRRRLVVGGLLVVGVLTPFYVTDFTDFQLARVWALAIAVLGLNLLTGYTGQISIGHGALMGVGAYTTVVLVIKAGMPYPVALLCATALCFFVGVLLGLPALRIRGLYLALVTLGFALVVPPLLKRFPELTGGVNGLPYRSPEAPLGLTLSSAQWLYFLNFGILVLVLLGVRNVVRGRVGRSLAAIRQNELMAVSNGVRIGRVKTLTFATSAALAGLGGGLYQLVLGTATPDTYVLPLSIGIITAGVIGGIQTLAGALIGAAFIVYVPDYAATVTERGSQLVYAVALLVAVYFFPQGIAGLAERVPALRSLRSPRPAPAVLDDR